MLNTLGLPGAKADARTLDLPVVASVCGSSYHDGSRGARAGEYLVAGESHGPAVVARNDCSFPDKLLAQDFVRVLGTGPGNPGGLAFEHGELSVNLPSGSGNPVLLYVQLEDWRADQICKQSGWGRRVLATIRYLES